MTITPNIDAPPLMFTVWEKVTTAEKVTLEVKKTLLLNVTTAT
jgi:hypothetical protein